jgi:hypothetical protein
MGQLEDKNVRANGQDEYSKGDGEGEELDEVYNVDCNTQE